MSISECIQGKSRRKFLDQKSISPHLYCSICNEVFEEPQRLHCGHTFCYVCITHWMNYSKKCPMCKQLSIIRRRLETDLIASKMVDDLRVQCSHEGCKWEGIYCVLKKHQRTCKLRQKKQRPQVRIQSAVEISDSEQVMILSDSNS